MENNYKTIPASLALGLFFIFTTQPAFAQNGVKIAATSGIADASAMLDITSSSKGVLIPRVNLVALTNSTSPVNNPATGLLVYNLGGGGVAATGFFFWNGSSWVQLNSGGLSGAGITNYVPVFTSSNAIGNSTIYQNGSNVGIGTTNPLTNLHIAVPTGITTFLGTTRGMLTIDPGAYTSGNYSNVDFLYTTGSNPVARIGAQINGTGSTLNFGTSNNYAAGITNIAMTINNVGNVGIGTTTPSTALQVNGIVTATEVNANGAMINIYMNSGNGPLSGCGPATCSGGWGSAAALGYAWATGENTATDVFSTNGTGTITILKAGTYMCQFQNIAMPAATVGWTEGFIPWVNGGADGTSPGGYWYNHAYCPSGYWQHVSQFFYRSWAAGTTVSIGYLTDGTLTYWGYDGYLSMQIVRIN